MLGNKVDVDESKRVVCMVHISWNEHKLTLWTDLWQTSHGILPVKRRHSIL